MKTVGIDLGSREVKTVLMDDGKIVFKNKTSTIKFYREYCTYKGKLEVDLKRLGVENADNAVSTGYGRNNTDLLMFEPINEIKAHVYGAMFQSRLKEFVLLDIGGQDVKVVKVEKGVITDLELNEKCAASSGRFLENMAEILEISLEDMTGYFDDPVELNSTCSVFSESELIGKIAEGIDITRLCAGVNYSLYRRIRPMIKKFRGSRLVLSGGVAKNRALIEFLKKDFDEVILLEDPQFNGAIGCCSYMERRCGR